MIRTGIFREKLEEDRFLHVNARRVALSPFSILVHAQRYRFHHFNLFIYSFPSQHIDKAFF